MLYLDSPITIENVILYRDYLDEKLYYYLPNVVRIGKDEKSLHFTVYTDRTIQETELPTLDITKFGGLLNLDTELGPGNSETESIIIEKLKEISGKDDVKITPVPFEKGTVKLALMGKDSSKSEVDEAMEIQIVGATTPCLTGSHQAAFNSRMGGTAAQTLYDLLNNTPQTQLAVYYEMDYLGVIPAYNLEITVDFKATESYFNNHLDVGFDLEAPSNNLKVMVDADIDSIVQDLINDGTIIISETDYSEDHHSESNTSSQIDLVKTLVGTELFSPTVMPTAANTVLKETMDTAGDKDKKAPEGKEKQDDKDKKTPDGKEAQAGGDKKAPDNKEAQAGSDKKDSKGENKPSDSPEQEETDDKKSDSEKEKTEKSKVIISANVGYTLRHRKISEQVKRTFKFNRREVKRLPFAISGMLSTTKDKFNPAEQVHITKLGVGEFHTTKLRFFSGFDFAEMGITNAKIDWRFEDVKEWDSGILNKDNTQFVRSVMHNDEATQNIIYKASFVTNDYGTVETGEITTTEPSVSIGLDKLKDKQFVRILFGSLETFSNVIVKVMPDGKEDNTMKMCRQTADHPNQTLMIDKCDTYDVAIEYHSKTGKTQHVTHRGLTGEYFAVDSPRTVEIATLRGASTFSGDIEAIEVHLLYNGQDKEVFLTSDELTGEVSFDYEVIGESPQNTLSVTYTIYRSDGSEEKVDAGTFADDTEKIRLKIFQTKKTASEEEQ